MPRGGPRYKGKQPPDLPSKPGPPPKPKPKPSPKPKYQGKKPSKPKKIVKQNEDLLKIAEEEYGDSKYAGDIARANPQVRNITAGVVLNLPTIQEPEPEIPELTMVRPRRRNRFGAPGRRYEPEEEDLRGGGGVLQPPGFPPAPRGVPQGRPVPELAPEGRFLEPGYAGRPAPTQYTQFGPQVGPPAPGQPTQAAQAITGAPLAPTGPGTVFEDIFQRYGGEGRPFAVLDEEGRPTYGTSIVPYLFEQGIAPLMITPYDVNVLGLDKNLLMIPVEEGGLGYILDDWGNLIRTSLEPGEAPPAGGGGYAGGGYGGYYGYGRGGGGGGRGVGGGGRPASYSGRQILDYLGLGQVSWRI